MQIPEVTTGASIPAFIGVGISLLAFAYGLRLMVRSDTAKTSAQSIALEIRQYTGLSASKPIPTTNLLRWAWARGVRATAVVVVFLGGIFAALGFVWTKNFHPANEMIISLYILVAFATVAYFMLSNERVRNKLHLWNTSRFLDVTQTGKGSRRLQLKSVKDSFVKSQWRGSFIRDQWYNLKRLGVIFTLTLLIALAPMIALLPENVDLSYKVGLAVSILFIALFVRISLFSRDEKVSSRDLESENTPSV